MANNCASCGKIATLSCAGCDTFPTAHDFTLTRSVYYCNSECQIAHFPSHKHECQDARLRQTLLMLTTALKACVDYHNKMTATYPIKLVRGADRKVTILTNAEGVRKRFSPSGVFSVWPNDSKLIADLNDDDQKKLQMFLGRDTCSEISLLVGPIMQHVLKKSMRSSADVQIYHTQTSPDRAVILVEDAVPNLHLFHHEALSVESKNGTKYLVDLVGDQYGWATGVFTPKEYATKTTPFSQNAFVSLATAFRDGIDPEKNGIEPLATLRLCIKLFNERICTWLQDHPDPAAKLRTNGDIHEFAAWLKHFIAVFKSRSEQAARQADMRDREQVPRPKKTTKVEFFNDGSPYSMDMDPLALNALLQGMSTR